MKVQDTLRAGPEISRTSLNTDNQVRDMGSQLRLSVVWAALLATSLATACSDSTSPRQPPPGPGVSVSIAFCASAEPNWVAFQDGDGVWTTAQPIVNGSRTSYEHSFNSSRAAIAVTRLFPQQRLTSVAVTYGAPAELAIVGDTNPFQCGGTDGVALLGSVTGFDTNEVASIAAGLSIRALVPPGGDNSFALQGLTPGPQEILATRTTRVSATSLVVTKMILRRTGELPDSSVLPVFDFASAEAFTPAISSVTVGGLGPEGATVNTLLRTPHSLNLVSIANDDMTAATRDYRAIPASHLETGDLQVLTATAGPVQGNVIRSATLFFRAPTPQTLNIGPPVATPTIMTVATTPSLRLRAHFEMQPEYDQLTQISFQTGTTRTTVMTVAMTAAYAALAGGSYDLVVPDLAQAAGFDPSWGLQPGGAIFWSASRIGGTLVPGLNAVPTEGATTRNALTFDTMP
jgi:hypothetical protein